MRIAQAQLILLRTRATVKAPDVPDLALFEVYTISIYTLLCPSSKIKYCLPRGCLWKQLDGPSCPVVPAPPWKRLHVQLPPHESDELQIEIHAII